MAGGRPGAVRRLASVAGGQAVAVVLFGAPAVWAVGLAVLGRAPVASAAAAVVLFEYAVVAARSAWFARPPADRDATAARVRPVLEVLCRRAGCETPSTRVGGSFTTASVRQKGQGSQLAIGGDFAARLDDRELAAILAHEVSHARHDLDYLFTLRMIVMVAGIGPAVTAWILLPHLEYLPVCWAAELIGMRLARMAVSPTQRSRERRADAEGARLCGDPAALAAALVAADRFTREARERLRGGQPWRTVLWPMFLRVRTHPRLADRVAGLSAQTAEA